MPDVQQMTRDEFRNYVMSRPATYWREGVALHHTTNEGVFGIAGWNNVMNYHLSLGWRDTGYHVGIDPDGSIYRLRPMEDSGAHIGDPYNQQYIGVSLQGNYNSRYVTPEQADAIRFVIATIGERYDTGMAYILHRDVDATACPGYNITHELVDQWLAGNTGYQPPVIQLPAPPAPDLSYATKPTAPKPPFTFISGSGECLGLDDEALEVMTLEVALKFLGYITYTPRTYLYDEYTEAGVKAFQAAYCAPVDGIYGINTANALDREITRVWEGQHPSVTPPNPPPVVVEPPAPPVIIPPLEPPPEETPVWWKRFLQALIDFLTKWVGGGK